MRVQEVCAEMERLYQRYKIAKIEDNLEDAQIARYEMGLLCAKEGETIVSALSHWAHPLSHGATLEDDHDDRVPF